MLSIGRGELTHRRALRIAPRIIAAAIGLGVPSASCTEFVPSCFKEDGPLVQGPALLAAGGACVAGSAVGAAVGFPAGLIPKRSFDGRRFTPIRGAEGGAFFGAIVGYTVGYLAVGTPVSLAKKLVWDAPSGFFSRGRRDDLRRRQSPCSR